MTTSGENRFAILDGKKIPLAEAAVPLMSPGILFGAGLFETIKAGPGCAYWVAPHVERMLAFARELEIPVRRSAPDLVRDAALCVSANPWGPAALKVVALLRDDRQADAWVVPLDEPRYAPALYESGAALAVSPHRQNERGMLSGKKTLNYFERYLARREAKRLGVLDFLYLNTQDEVAEGTFLNVSWLKGGTVFTPELGAGILSGTTRKVVLELLARNNTPVHEGRYPLSHLLEADEAFLTSSNLEVAPLVRVGERAIGSGAPGPFVRRLMELYRAERDARGTLST